MNPILIKSYRVSAAIAGYLIAAHEPGNTLTLATGPTDLLAGAVDQMGASNAGDMVDVSVVGVSEVRGGGTIVAGDPLTSDANAKAVKAVPVAGSDVRVIGIAQVDAEDGDILTYLVAPGVMSTPA